MLAGGCWAQRWGRGWRARARRFITPFLGAYVLLIGVAVLAGADLVDRLPGAASASRRQRAQLGELMRQPVFLVAVLASALGYGVMNLLMAATPIAMGQCGLPFSDSTWVLRWHVLGMFVPSFFTGSVIKRVGVMPVLWAGVVSTSGCVAVALSGQDRTVHGGPAAAGRGWNFLYVGGTTLFTQAYRPEEKTRPGLMDTWVYLTMTLTSFSSGALVTTGGWVWMNEASLPHPAGRAGTGLARSQAPSRRGDQWGDDEAGRRADAGSLVARLSTTRKSQRSCCGVSPAA